MQQVGCRVIASRAVAKHLIDHGPEFSGRVFGQALGDVQDFVVLLAGVEDVGHVPVFGLQVPLVADLAPALGVERRLVEDQLVPYPFFSGFHLAVFGEPDLGLQLVVPHKACTCARPDRHPVFHGRFGCRPRAAFLGLHGLIKARFIEFITPLPQDQGGQVNREAEGVVELKGLFPVYGAAFGLFQDVLQKGEALVQGFQEGVLFFPNHILN